MRWWCILCVSVLWRTATAKAVKEIDNVSEASSMRQCCPCPEPGQTGIPRSSFADQGFGSSLRSLAYPDQEPFGTSTSGARTSLADVDDCPCRPRNADSTGSASMFFPTAMRAARPFVSLEDEKEESKPLLHPEVNLASSVLETLRQATDEEYEDALARDAARSVVRAMEPDSILQGVRNLIPVIANPTQKYIDDDGEVAKASNKKETRYLNPSLTRTNSRGIPLLNPPNFPLSDIFKKTTRKSALNEQLDIDSDVGASNINENVVPISQARFDLKPKMGLLNTLPEDNNILKKNRLSIPKLSDVLKNIEDTFSSKSRSSVNSDGDRISNTNTFSKMFDTIPILSSGSNDGANKFDEVENSDNINSPSNVKERYSGFNFRGNSEKSIKDTDAITTLTEIRKKILETKIPQLKLNPENRDTTGDLFTDIIKSLENSRSLLPPNLFNTPSKTTAIESADIENKDFKNSIADDTKTFSTKIVDTVSSSTTPNVNAIECLPDVKDENRGNESAESDPSIKTKIIDNMPSTSNVIEIINSNPENTELDPADSNEEQKISDNTSNERVLTTDTEMKDNNSDGTNDSDETTEDEVNDDTKDFQTDGENCLEKQGEASAASNVFQNQIDEGLAGDGIASENSNHPSISTNIKEVTADDPKSIEDDENCESHEANFQTERESCLEEEDEMNAASNVFSKQIIDESVSDGIASESSNLPSISSNIKAVTEDDPKTIEDEENCESTDVNFQTERENCSEDEDEASAASNVFPKQITDELAGNGMPSENFNRQSISSNIKAVPKHDPKSIKNEENCELSKALNGNNKILLPSKGSLLERLRKPKPKINQQKMTPDTKRDNDISSQLSIDDLQKMSNSLLDQEKLLIGALAERNIKNTEQSNKSKGYSKAKDATVYQKTNKPENECNEMKTSPEKHLDFVSDSKKTNEMMSEASETVGSALKPVTIPRSSLLSNVLQPFSLFDGSTNLFNLPTVSLTDIFRNPLPSLSMPNLFSKMESEKNDNRFTEKDAGMSSLASTSNSKSIWPPFSPLEDLNLDILQLKPLGLPQSSSMPMLPRLNLNSYKTKLAIPKSLPLKPVILESSVSNKKGMVGASISFGKEKKRIKPKHATKNRAADIIGNQIALPSLHDLQENFLENAQNFLSTPLETTGRNIIGDTFRSGQVLTENLKVKAKNVVSDLQKNFESTLKGTGTSILGSPLRSSDIFEEISKKHEDWGDKLKGIHHDFSDRLETLRNNILDQIPRTQIARPSSNLKAIQKPSRLASRVNKNKTPPTRNRTIKKPQKPVKSKALNMLSSPSIISPKIAESPKSIDHSPDLASPSSNAELPLLNSKRRPLLDIFHKKPSFSLRNSLLKPKLKENKVKITFETTPRPVLKTYPSTTRSKPRYNSKPLLSEESSPHNSHLRGKALPLRSAYDGNESPSEMKAVHTKPPLRVPIRPKSTIKPISEFKATPKVLKSNKPASTFKPKNTGLNKSLEVSSRQTASGKPKIGNKLSKTGLSDIKSPSWPRIIDDKFLTNVREALKGRLAGLGPAKHQSASKLGKTDSRSSDMARSASNAVEVVASKYVVDVVSPISESMKENTSYSCQMVCKQN